MTVGWEQGSMRDARGRFVPGQSGNPSGKAPGTPNRATLLRAALDSEEGPAMARVIIDKALAGDVVTARFCLDRLEPRQRGRAIAIDLPEGARACDVVAAFDATVEALASGEITPDEAVQVTRVLDGRRKAIEAARREREWDERQVATKPSPPRRGLGEGAGCAFAGPGIASAPRPHPGPLPQGEGGAIAGEGVAGLESASLLPRERGQRSRFAGDLLHSTCIGSFPARSPGLTAGGWVV
jgi:hypothetical protein